MKSLIVYYSLEGNARLLAETLQKVTGGDLLFLEPVKAYPQKGIKKFLIGGSSVMRHQLPALKTALPSLAGYDRIYIGTPVWASAPTPPVATFMEKADLVNKEIALFACSMGGGAEKCFEKMRQKLEKQNRVLGEIEFTDPKKGDPALIEKHLGLWIEGLD